MSDSERTIGTFKEFFEAKFAALSEDYRPTG